MTAKKLPSAFAELERFAETWCLPTETERFSQRLASTIPELRVFYDAFFPRLEEAIDYCDKFALDELPEDALNLLHLIYSWSWWPWRSRSCTSPPPSTPPTRS